VAVWIQLSSFPNVLPPSIRSTVFDTLRSNVDPIPQRRGLIDGDELTRLLVRSGVGIRVERVIEFKRLDRDYLDEEEIGPA
jgi:restriction endonuclease Mrr